MYCPYSSCAAILQPEVELSYYNWSPPKAVPPDCPRQNNWSITHGEGGPDFFPTRTAKLDILTCMYPAERSSQIMHLCGGTIYSKGSLVPRPVLGRRNGLATSAARELSHNQISARCHMTTVNRIASCVERSQSRPIHRNS